MNLDITTPPHVRRQVCAEGAARWRHAVPGAPHGARSAIGLRRGGALVGVAVLGRPVARALDDGETAEVTRLCVIEGARHASSQLLGAAARLAGALGYRKVITYTLVDEGGASLRGAGWRLAAESPGGKWSRGARPRSDFHPTGPKIRWERQLRNTEGPPSGEPSADPSSQAGV